MIVCSCHVRTIFHMGTVTDIVIFQVYAGILKRFYFACFGYGLCDADTFRFSCRNRDVCGKPARSNYGVFGRRFVAFIQNLCLADIKTLNDNVGVGIVFILYRKPELTAGYFYRFF